MDFDVLFLGLQLVGLRQSTDDRRNGGFMLCNLATISTAAVVVRANQIKQRETLRSAISELVLVRCECGTSNTTLDIHYNTSP